MLLKDTINFMSSLQRVCILLGVWGLTGIFPAVASAQSGYVANGAEYAPAGYIAGDQIHPAVALNATNGFIVWQDNVTDGDGYGIRGIFLDSTLSPSLSSFRINQQGASDQEHPQVAILNNGGKVVAWQSGIQSFQHLYARFLTSSNTFIGGDVPVNSATNYQVNPVIAALPNGNVVMAWSSFGEDNADGFQGVYAQIFSPAGQKLLTNGEMVVNQFTPFNQRTPAVAAFPNGNFVVVWVSEKERSSTAANTNSGDAVIAGTDSVDVYGRLFNSNGTPLSDELLVNTETNVCANPVVATAADGSFTVVWGEKNVAIRNNSWDIFGRQFTGTTGGSVFGVNTQLYGDQYGPQITSLGTDYLVVWTSLGQDGSREGVFGQYLRNGAHLGSEFRVNTTILNSQLHPTVASDGAGRFLAVWSSFEQPSGSMDIMAQRYVTTLQPLSPPGAPVISAISPFTMSVSWAPLAGFSVDHWDVFVDSNSTPFTTTNIYWQNQSISQYTNLFLPGSTHYFQLAYVLTDGRQSPLSATASGRTWGADGNVDGLPDDWETLYWGPNMGANWPSGNTLLTIGSMHATAYQIFLWGANPTNAATWLTQTIGHTSQGWFLSWTTQPGLIYQVQSSTDLVSWTNLGGPRFAAGTNDSIFLGVGNHVYYRIARLIY